MARPFRKPGNGETQMYCDNCGEWDLSSRFTESEAYLLSGYLGDYRGESYYGSYYSYAVWSHDSCEGIVAVDEEPESRVMSEVWACGDCKDEYESLEFASECCT